MSTLDRSIRSFKENLADLLNGSNTYQINQDIYLEIKGIISALDAIKIDNLFLSTAAANSSSPAASWALNRSKLELSTSSKYKADPQMTQAIIGQGEVMLNELKIQLSKSNMASLRENEIRKINTNAKERLRAYIRNLHPFAYGSYVRLDNQVTELGVNNRYKTIRNELSKPQADPLDYYSAWNDKTLPGVEDFKTPDWRNYTFGLRHDDQLKRGDNKASCTNRYQAGSCFNKDEASISLINTGKVSGNLRGLPEVLPYETLRSYDNGAQPASSTQCSKSNSASANDSEEPWKKYAREAGINLEFPGISEQKSKYKVPEKENYKNFVINPQPDLTKYKRPFSMPIIEKKQTEYQFRYRFPDSKEIDKFPWIKQL